MIKPAILNSEMRKIFFIRSFGCQMNEADSEVMGRLLEKGEAQEDRFSERSGCHNS